MILDERLEFADAVAVTGTAASTYVLGDYLVLDNTTNYFGNADCVYLVINVDTDVAASGGAANVTFKLVSDSVATLDSSPTTHWSSGAIAKGTLVAGYQVCAIELPRGPYEKYVGVTYTPDTNNTTAGKVNAFLTNDPRAWVALADSIPANPT